MKTKAEILRILEEMRPELERKYGVARLAIFGSYARGEQHADSDVDILVEVDPSIGLRFVVLAEELEEALGTRVELITTRALKPSHFKFIQEDLIDVA